MQFLKEKKNKQNTTQNQTKTVQTEFYFSSQALLSTLLKYIAVQRVTFLGNIKLSNTNRSISKTSSIWRATFNIILLITIDT